MRSFLRARCSSRLQLLCLLPLVIGLMACTTFSSSQAEAESPIKASRPIKILFIGNSMTYYNDLPSMFQRFAAAAGIEVVVDSSTAPMYTLDHHADPQDPVGRNTYAKIHQGSWDYVVMQDLTDRSAYPDQRPKMLAGAQTLDTEIKATHARTLLYMTWAYAHGDGTYAKYPEARSFLGMQAMIQEGYLQTGAAIGASVVPMGAAWPEALHRWPESASWLYQPDNNHPRVAGTLMNVGVLYKFLFNADPRKVPDHEGLSDAQANFVLDVAASVPKPAGH